VEKNFSRPQKPMIGQREKRKASPRALPKGAREPGIDRRGPDAWLIKNAANGCARTQRSAPTRVSLASIFRAASKTATAATDFVLATERMLSKANTLQRESMPGNFQAVKAL